MRHFFLILCALVLAACSSPEAPQTSDHTPNAAALNEESSKRLKIIAWNIESGGSDLLTIINQMENDFDAVDIWALSEVPENAEAFFRNNFKLAGHDYGYQMSTNRYDDRLLMIYNKASIDLDEAIEDRSMMMGNNGLRPALGGHYVHRPTGKNFYLLNNHLSRGKPGKEYIRHDQTEKLIAFADEHAEEAVIFCGDFNYDYDIHKEGSYDRGFKIMTESSMQWLQPKSIVHTQCDWDSRRKKCRYYSVLDFFFVNDKASDWQAESRIIERDRDFPDNNKTSDHRPVEAIFYPK